MAARRQNSLEVPITIPPGLSSSASNARKQEALFPSPNSAQRVAGGGGLAVPQRQPRQKVVLKPGHSPLDWAELNRKSPSHILRGVPPETPPAPYIRINKEELKNHKTKEDCWTCINGKVFNITPYVNFHPGGVDEIMKCAGRDGTALFNKYHSWVNADRMLEKCFVGMMNRE